MKPERVAEIVALLMPIGARDEVGRALNEYVTAIEQCAIKNEREACARVAEKIYGGRAHTYASENADVYRAQDATCIMIADAIRSR